jgi:4,5-dihydroxyphthalate decarboxylase
MNWVTFQPERLEGLEVPAHLDHRLEIAGRSSEELAAAGELDATLSRGAGRVRERETADAKPLLGLAFADPVAASHEYYQRTGVYPVQHVVAMREKLADDAAVVESVCEAFSQAKEVARTKEATPETNDFLEDAWPYGISANRNTLEAFVGAAHEQGLTSRLYSVEELFPANLPDAMR